MTVKQNVLYGIGKIDTSTGVKKTTVESDINKD